MLFWPEHLSHDILPLEIIGKLELFFQPLMMLGKVIKTFFTGDENLKDDFLKKADEDYVEAVTVCQFELCLSMHQKIQDSRSLPIISNPRNRNYDCRDRRTSSQPPTERKQDHSISAEFEVYRTHRAFTESQRTACERSTPKSIIIASLYTE